MTAQITWALCPNGVITSATAPPVFRFSVLVSPVLASIADLGLASGQTWAAKMAAMTPTLYVGSTAIPVAASALDKSVMTLYPTIWSELFGANPPVRSFTRPPVPQMNIVSYDSHQVSSDLHGAYRSAASVAAPKPSFASAASSTALSAFATLSSQVSATSSMTSQNGTVKTALLAGLNPTAGAKTALVRNSVLTQSSFLTTQSKIMTQTGTVSDYNPTYVGTAMFHNRSNLRGVPSVPPPGAYVPPDFHDALAQLADQPEILRALGFILDYTVSIPTSLYSTGTTVYFEPSGAPGGPSAQTTPPVYCVISATQFYASAPASVASDVDEGMLTLESTNFLVEPLDLDHAVNTLASAAVPDTTASTISVPALRSNGFQVLRTQRDAYYQGRVTKSFAVAETTGTAATPLYSDDIVRGYRVDVSNDGTHWTPLCKRQGSVQITGASGTVQVNLPTPSTALADYPFARDEGYVKASAATTPVDAPNLLQLHEALFGWHGWSLVARHPSLPVGFDGTQTNINLAGPNSSPSASPFQVTQSVNPQNGSLPLLRYGKSYQFRARVVDLAGNSLPLSAPGTSVQTGTLHATPPRLFGRYDPILTPTLVPRERITEGEALERLVIRSSGVAGVTAAAFAPTVAAAAASTTPSGATVPAYFGTCERHVVPPKVAQATAERHGMFDAMTPQTAWQYASTLDGSFMTPAAGSTSQTGWSWVEPRTGGGAIVSAQLPSYLSPPAAPGSAPNPGAYPFISGTAVVLPYLPDPLAAGVQLSVSQDIASDVNAATVTSVAQPTVTMTPALASMLDLPQTVTKAYAAGTGGWPNVTPFRLALQDSAGAAPSVVANGTDGNIDVFIPAGTMLWLDYSSTPQTGIVAPGGTTTGLQHLGWYQELPAATQSAIETSVAVGRHWMFTPRRQLQLVHATLKPVQAPTISTLAIATRPANATYAYLNATVGAHSQSTAHVDLMAQWNDWDDGSGTWVPRAAKVAQTHFTYGAGAQTITGAKQEFADTKARQISYAPVGTTRYREYFPPSMTAQSSAITLEGAPFAPVAATSTQLAGVIVPASRQPHPPKPLYVLPSYLRTVSGSTSTRLGSTLRIYLDRPWFDSGFGEQLAILCQPANAPYTSDLGPANAPVANLTQVGLDPLFIAEGGEIPILTDGLGLSSYTGMYASQIQIDTSGRMQLISNYLMPDGTYADLVVFNVDHSDVATDPRGLFFVDVTMPNYQSMFVSFALARYQPNAIGAGTAKSAQLSSIVRADFTRISADRMASVTTTASSVSVTVSGPSASTTPAPVPASSGSGTTSGGNPIVKGGGGTGGGTGGGGTHTQEVVVRTPFATTTTSSPTPLQYAQAGSSGRYLQATLESTTNPAPADLDNELGWAQVGTFALAATTGASPGLYTDTVTWTGTYTFTRAASTRYRVVIREFEQHGADPDVALASGTASWMGTGTGSTLDALVYSDILPC